jgi:HEPN domain-containing protein
MDKTEELRQWFEIAHNDLALAEHAFNTMHPTPDEQICFHCQQSAEKYLKGFLVTNNIDPPAIHDLDQLRKLCEQINPSFNTLLAICIVLTQYGVMPRYPNELQITEADVRIALQYAKDIKAFVDAVIK